MNAATEQAREAHDRPPPRRQRLRALAAESARYVVVAGISFLWVMGSSAALHELVGLSQQLAVALALVSALGINFTLLRLFVFPGQSTAIGSQLAATAAVSASFRGLEYLGFLLLNGPVGLHYLTATAAALLASSLAKFLIYRNIVFRRAPADPAAATAQQPDKIGSR